MNINNKMLNEMIVAKEEMERDLNRLHDLKLGLSIQTLFAIENTIKNLEKDIRRVKQYLST